MTITIPIWLLWLVGIVGGWYVFGLTVNTCIIRPLRNRWMRKHGTGIVPRWYLPTCVFLCGPIAWMAWVAER